MPATRPTVEVTPDAVRTPVAEYHRLLEADPAAAREQSAMAAARPSCARGSRSTARPCAASCARTSSARADWDRLRAAGRRVCSSWPRAWPAHAFDGRRGRLCAFLGHARGGGPLGRARPRPAGRRRSRAWTRSSPPTARASSRSTATPPPASATATAWPRVFDGAAALPGVRASASGELPLVRGRAWCGRSWRRGARRAARARRVVAIVDWAEVKTRADQEILRERSSRRAGVGCVLVDPREMEIRDGRLCTPASSRWTSSTAAPSSPSWWSARTR